MKDVRFSQQCGNIFLGLTHTADRATMILQNIGSYYPVTQYNILSGLTLHNCITSFLKACSASGQEQPIHLLAKYN
jgi:hypothetical protein